MIKKGGLNYWFPSYIRAIPEKFSSRRIARQKTRHLFFLICDHFEPRHQIQESGQDFSRVDRWERDYSAFYNRCVAEFGHGPRHSWFYPPHHGLEHLAALNRLVLQGCGEIELHLHHNNDTSESLRELLKKTIFDYNRRGLLLSGGEKPRSSFAFIHGDWALDNSHPDGKYCGVNDELTILREFGCWGDFTMPSSESCQTRKINSIYYALDDKNLPKSHDTGIDLRVGKQPPPNALFMMQGPLTLNFRAPKYPRIENASLTTANWGRDDRIRSWLNCHIHVKGKPEWIFLKLHAHGAVERDFDALFGDRAWQMHKMLNENYNDGVSYRLHYVTAREAYNICKAAEAGLEGDPGIYRDFEIGRYAHNHYHCSAIHQLLGAGKGYLKIRDIEVTKEEHVTLTMPSSEWLTASGQFTELTWTRDSNELVISTAIGEKIALGCGGRNLTVKGARILNNSEDLTILVAEAKDLQVTFAG